MEELKYPIGRFTKPEIISTAYLMDCISTIEFFPSKLKEAVSSLDEVQLDTPYRPEGWTVRQLVNHCADSHMNALIRLKLALTENAPTINAYKQDAWAKLTDSEQMSIVPALQILDGLHARWGLALRSLNQSDWQKSYIHPEKGRAVSIEEATANYTWHCEHHLGHVLSLKKRLGWK
jgi:hypothetical protein